MPGTLTLPVEHRSLVHAASHAVAASPSAPQWFAAYTMPRHEKRVADHLKARHIEHFLPCSTANRKWKDGSKGTVELPLFPKYIFVQIDPRTRVQVLEVPGVVSFVRGLGGSLAPLPTEDIERLREAVHTRLVEPHPYFVVGQRARIHSGLLAGMEGVVVRSKNDLRIVLTIETIMSSFSLEVDGSELELIGEAHS
jgi:transcription antitermination factor NusG